MFCGEEPRVIGDASCSVEETPDQTSLYVCGVVGVKVKVPIGVCGLPIDRNASRTSPTSARTSDAHLPKVQHQCGFQVWPVSPFHLD